MYVVILSTKFVVELIFFWGGNEFMIICVSVSVFVVVIVVVVAVVYSIFLILYKCTVTLLLNN